MADSELGRPQRRYRAPLDEIRDPGYIATGSVIERYTACTAARQLATGPLAATRTGLSPASDDELTKQTVNHLHDQPPIPTGRTGAAT